LFQNLIFIFPLYKERCTQIVWHILRGGGGGYIIWSSINKQHKNKTCLFGVGLTWRAKRQIH
jgi:hypothetical protein